MERILIFDVETPNRQSNRICSIAVSFLQHDEVVDHFHCLINPEASFDSLNIEIHGITPEDVEACPVFSDVWPRLAEYFSSSIVVAHNATFDLAVLRKTLESYNIRMPALRCADTVKIARKLFNDVPNYKLSTLCNEFSIELCNHHDAACDARACAELLRVMLRKYRFDIEQFVYDYPKIEKSPPKLSEQFVYDYPKIKKSPPKLSEQFVYDYPKIEKSPPKLSERYPVQHCSETQNLQILRGILIGIISDGEVNEKEFFSLVHWLEDNRHLAGRYPFDRVYAAISHVLEDGLVEQDELDQLLLLFHGFLDPVEGSKVTSRAHKALTLSGKSFVLTGTFSVISRSELSDFLIEHGALCVSSVSRKTSCVIVGELGSPDWKFGSYGSKVQKAQELIEGGARISILKEKDFLSRLEESGLCLTK